MQKKLIISIDEQVYEVYEGHTSPEAKATG
jgi:hypothetical protein